MRMRLRRGGVLDLTQALLALAPQRAEERPRAEHRAKSENPFHT